MALFSPGFPGSMEITWTTFNETEESTVEYGLWGGRLFELTAKGNATLFVDGGSEGRKMYIHRVTLTDLRSASVYVYHCGSEAGWSDVFSFTALNESTSWSPRFAIYGDMGNENPQSLARLQKETQVGTYDVILHVGDFAYDMHEDNGRIGDEFMRQIQSIAAYVPYMTCPGNHEAEYATLSMMDNLDAPWILDNFSNYRNRFSMPGQTESLWYSWNVGSAHIISLSTEIYFFLDYGVDLLFKQYEWLKKDLEVRLGRNDTKPPAPGLEDLLYLYGVDLELWAHEHTYERLWPVYGYKVFNGSMEQPYVNPKAPVHIITGSAGCRENHDPFVPNPRDWSAFRSTDYGYTRMQVHNTTHLYLEQVSDDQYGKVIDSIWVVKEKHGFSAWF
ncbi:unnamed protein product [Coregonus sp. 'balchen']|nr:unnamed protein product [Coregonus sp. 'balchen']